MSPARLFLIAVLALPGLCLPARAETGVQVGTGTPVAAGPPRDIGAFIRVFLKNDHQVAISREAVRSSEIAERRSGDRADSKLTYNPAYTYTRERGLGGAGSLDDRNLSNTLDYTHTAGYGTTFGASAGHSNDSSSLYSWQQDTYSSELSVSQPLLRNRFGGLWNADRKSKGLARESTEFSHRDKTLARYLAAADIYSRAHTAQRKAAIFGELLENMRKLWEQTQKDYRKKLMAKLNYLSVKSNWFEMLDTKERIETERRQRLSVLNLYTNEPWQEELASPEGFFADNPVPKDPGLDSHPSVRAAAKKVDSLKMRARYLKLNDSPDLGLDGSVGYGHTVNAPTYYPRDKDTWTAKIGLSLSLPVLDRVEIEHG
ncbi:TolC family protein [Elusimicrobiota bacterium]